MQCGYVCIVLIIYLAHQAAASGSVFQHGVMSGAPLPDSVILWTRLTLPTMEGAFVVEYQVGSMKTRPDAVANIVAEGVASTSADVDYTVHVDVGGLDPYSVYYYQFRYRDEEQRVDFLSAVGKTMTSPLPGQHVEGLTLGVASCASWLWGYYHAYEALSKVEGLEMLAFLGDYIYEYGDYIYPSKEEQHARAGTPLDPPGEAVTLQDYRRRYALVRSDKVVQALHAAAPVAIAKWDDHEFADDVYHDLQGALNHQPICYGKGGSRPGDDDFEPIDNFKDGQPCDKDEGNWIERVDAATRAFYEWMPLRFTAEVFNSNEERRKNSQTLQWGDLVTGYAPEEVLASSCTNKQEDCDCEELAKEGSTLMHLVEAHSNFADYYPGTELYRELEVLISANYKCTSSSGFYRISQEDEAVMAALFSESKQRGVPWQIFFSAQVFSEYQPRNYFKAANSLHFLKDAAAFLQYANEQIFEEEPRFRAEYALALFQYATLGGWDKYRAQRARLTSFFADTTNSLLIFSGDSHDPWAYDLITDKDTSSFADRHGRRIGAEFSTPAISSPGRAHESVPFWDIFASVSLFPAEGFRVADVANEMTNEKLRYSREKDNGVIVSYINHTHTVAEYLYISSSFYSYPDWGFANLREKQWNGKYVCDSLVDHRNTLLYGAECQTKLSCAATISSSAIALMAALVFL